MPTNFDHKMVLHRTLNLIFFLTGAITYGQSSPLTLSWDKLGCQQTTIREISLNSNTTTTPCLEVCPGSMSIYRISGEDVANISQIQWDIQGGEAAVSDEFSTAIRWNDSAEGLIVLMLIYKNGNTVEKSVCVEKTNSLLILKWDKIGCQIDGDNVSEMKFNSNISNVGCLKVCPKSDVTYEIFGDGLSNIASVHWTVAGGISQSENEYSNIISWDESLNGSISVAITYNNGTNIVRTLCVRKIPPSILLNWDKLESSVCEIKYDNSPDKVDVLLVYPESTVFYKIGGDNVSSIQSINWNIVGGYAYTSNQTSTMITWDDFEKGSLQISILYNDGRLVERSIIVARMQAPIGGDPAPNSIAFDYDDSGNQIKRKVIYLSSRKRNPVKENANFDQKKPIKSDEYSDISYYPNPVKSELYVNWFERNGEDLETIEVYDLNGKIVKKFTHLNKVDNATINLDNNPAGMYNVNLIYVVGSPKVLKIVKQ